MPAIRPDVAIVHAQMADSAGNVLIEGIVGVQKEAVLAAKRSIVTVEEVVRSLSGLDQFQYCCAAFLEHHGPVVEAPGGARPSDAHGYYKRDNAFYVAWDTISRDRADLPGLDGRARLLVPVRGPTPRGG